jgi:hypothetical protein
MGNGSSIIQQNAFQKQKESDDGMSNSFKKMNDAAELLQICPHFGHLYWNFIESGGWMEDFNISLGKSYSYYVPHEVETMIEKASTNKQAEIAKAISIKSILATLPSKNSATLMFLCVYPYFLRSTALDYWLLQKKSPAIDLEVDVEKMCARSHLLQSCSSALENEDNLADIAELEDAMEVEESQENSDSDEDFDDVEQEVATNVKALPRRTLFPAVSMISPLIGISPHLAKRRLQSSSTESTESGTSKSISTTVSTTSSVMRNRSSGRNSRHSSSSLRVMTLDASSLSSSSSCSNNNNNNSNNDSINNALDFLANSKQHLKITLYPKHSSPTASSLADQSLDIIQHFSHSILNICQHMHVIYDHSWSQILLETLNAFPIAIAITEIENHHQFRMLFPFSSTSSSNPTTSMNTARTSHSSTLSSFSSSRRNTTQKIIFCKLNLGNDHAS